MKARQTQPSTLDAALLYAEMGIAVFPCKVGSKDPATLHGFKDASTDPETIRKMWRNPNYNIGGATGLVSGIVVVDIDPRNGGDDSLTNLQGVVGLLDTVTSMTGGGGNHYFFAYPEQAYIPSCKLDAGIDIKSDGGYVIMPSSVVLQPNGAMGAYDWEASSDPSDGVAIMPLPEKLLPMLVREKPDPAGHGISVPRDQWIDPATIAELRDALNHISSDEYFAWIKTGMALYSIGNDDTAFRLWDEWSQTSPKYDAREMGKRWRGFETRHSVNKESIFWQAQKNGWINKSAPAAEPVPVEMLNVKQGGTMDDTIPEMLLNPPGIVGEIADYINATAYRRQPVFAVAAALSLCAALLARRVMTQHGSRTNLMLCSLGGTGSGKDWARKVIVKFLDEAGKGDILGGEIIASGQALITRAKMTPTALFQIDEFGDFLLAAQNPNAASHKAEIVTNLMRLYTSSGSIFKGTEYANQKDRERQDIEYPCINLHATSTQETFYSSLGSRDLANGFLNRLIVCESLDQLPPKQKHRIVNLKTPDSIIDWIRSVDHIQGAGNLQGVSPANPLVVLSDDAASAIFDEFDDWCEDQVRATLGTGVDALWNRAAEHAQKIALILASGDYSPTITAQYARWAVVFIRYWTQRLANAVQRHVSDSASHAVEQEIVRLLERAGSDGLTTRELGLMSRKFRAAPPAMRDAALNWLAKAGQVQQAEIKNISGRGKKRIAWVLLQEETQ